jgi:hypothetical protein
MDIEVQKTLFTSRHKALLVQIGEARYKWVAGKFRATPAQAEVLRTYLVARPDLGIQEVDSPMAVEKKARSRRIKIAMAKDILAHAK